MKTETQLIVAAQGGSADAFADLVQLYRDRLLRFLLTRCASYADAEDALLEDPMAGGLPPVPGSFRVTMTGDQGHVLWREVIHHHGY